MIKTARVIIMTAIIGFASASALAANDLDLIITGSGASKEVLDAQDPSLENQELKVTYDPKDFAGEVDTSGNREMLLKSILAEMNVAKPEADLFIPRAPMTEQQFTQLEQLNEFELQSFLGKKQKFLEKMAKILTALHLKPKFINKVLAEVNTKFYNSSRLIAKSNAVGGTVMLSISGGLALPQKIVEKLQNRPIGKYIPKSGGFAFLMGLGIGFSRRTNENGRPSWVLDVFVDTERLRSTLSGIAEVSAAGTYGVTYELREGKFHSQKTETTYGGAAGVFRQGPNQFGWAASTGLSIPPGIGAFVVTTNNTTRHYIVRLDTAKLTANPIEPLLQIINSWMHVTGFRNRGGALSCAKAFL